MAASSRSGRVKGRKSVIGSSNSLSRDDDRLRILREQAHRHIPGAQVFERRRVDERHRIGSDLPLSDELLERRNEFATLLLDAERQLTPIHREAHRAPEVRWNALA